MILNKENYELLLFDLLEGNLPPEVAMELEVEIENNDFYKNEYELLKATVLSTDDEIVFANTASLLKEKAIRAIPMYFKISGAVAASLLLLVTFYFIKNDEGTTETNIAIENTDSSQYNNIAEAKIAKTKEAKENHTKKEDNSVITTPKTKEYAQELFKKKTKVKTDKSNLNKDQAPEKINMRREALVKPNLMANIEILQKINYSDITFDTYRNDELTELQEVGMINNNNIQNVTLNFRERITYNLAKFSHPKIKIRPVLQGKRPTLIVQVNTDGYFAQANIAPFRIQ